MPAPKKRPAASRIIRCPRCRKSCRFDATNPFRPFCSDLCKNEDIASWATEDYKIAGAPVNPEVAQGAAMESEE